MKTIQVKFKGEMVAVTYLSPKDWIRFLLNKAPELLLGGASPKQAGAQLEAFWANYRLMHGTHVLFDQESPLPLDRTVPVQVHGDEGRGLKKGNTAVVMLEAVLGLAEKDRKRNISQCCDNCDLEPRFAKLFKTEAGRVAWTADEEDAACASQVTNLKENSYLSKFTMAAFPHGVYKETDLIDQLHELVSLELKDLFHNGILCGNPPQRWHVACTGFSKETYAGLRRSRN